MSLPNPFASFRRFLSRLFKKAPPPDQPPAPPAAPTLPAPTSINPRVLMIIYNPVVEPATGRKLVEVMHWNDPDTLSSEYILDVRECSDGVVNYQVAERVEVDEIPIKADGFRYEPQAYLQAMRAPTPRKGPAGSAGELATGSGFHEPDAVDYGAILHDWDLLGRVEENQFDEVWLFGGPFFGFSESVMAGAHSFFINGGPIPKTDDCPRRFVIMGFNYERGVGEMLEDLGHRTEFTLAHLYGSDKFLWWAYNAKREPAHVTEIGNVFERFLCFESIAPGKANVGTMHYAPNSLRDYDWGNRTPVLSCCDDWLAYPHLPDPPSYRAVSARHWGSGDIRAHHKWWLSHIPRASGETNGISNNWWKYVVQLNDAVYDRKT